MLKECETVLRDELNKYIRESHLENLLQQILNKFVEIRARHSDLQTKSLTKSI